jgi:hypothetical protein
VFGALVHKRKTGGAAHTYGELDARLLNEPPVNALLERVKAKNTMRGGAPGATYLLSQVFPEAAPAHPAWPSGHATLAGACVTVIKAIFDDRHAVLQQTPEKRPFTDENGVPLTVGGELDKLASNIALGRNFGGVHFRSDGEHGILLGEQLAIRFLQDHLRTYRERFRCTGGPHGGQPCFELGLRSGQRVHITPDDVDPARANTERCSTTCAAESGPANIPSVLEAKSALAVGPGLLRTSLGAAELSQAG